MFSISEEIPINSLVKYFGPAKVLDKSRDGKCLLLGLEKSGDKIQTWGKIIISSSTNFSFGDIVLAAGDDINLIYVLGLLESSSNTENKLIAANGAYASIKKNNSEEKILVHSPQGDLIFEYDSLSGKSIVNVQSGDLEFASKGNINFSSEGNINLKGRQSVQIESENGIRISVKNLIDRIQSSIFLDKIKTKFSSPNLNIISKRADLEIDISKYIGTNFSLVMKHTRIIADKFENIANDIITRAKNVFKTVEELTQLKTGRLRTLVSSTIHVKSKNSYQFAEEDFKVNADKIHLG